MLTEATGEYVSSRTICELLQTSRTAVWKHIHALQKLGYQVEAVPNKGYRLFDSTDFVTPHEIKHYIGGENFAKNIAYQDSIDSTNRAARQLAEQGAPEGTLVIADEQTQGRGRFQRKWYSPANSGIWMSLIIRPNLSIAEAPRLTILSAVAVAKTLTKLSMRQASIKWPNDVLIDGKKICGILTEVSAEGNQINYVIVGIGINVNVSPAALPTTIQSSVCSLQEFVNEPMKRAYVAAKVLTAFEDYYNNFMGTGDFADILGYFKRHSVTLGHTVEIASASSHIIGMAEDIDENGALVVRMSDHQMKKLYSGDIL